MLQPTHIAGTANGWADDFSRDRLARFANQSQQRLRFTPESINGSGQQLTLHPASAPWRPERRAATRTLCRNRLFCIPRIARKLLLAEAAHRSAPLLRQLLTSAQPDTKEDRVSFLSRGSVVKVGAVRVSLQRLGFYVPPCYRDM